MKPMNTQKKALEVFWKKTFEEAAIFFSTVPSIRRGVKVVCDIGLGYLRLGQTSPTISGGAFSYHHQKSLVQTGRSTYGAIAFVILGFGRGTTTG